ncbi:HNH endonuclease [uncultured Algoriphagus sp.]|uniref:HNH endonuclease n=1 Tax=uncultured Algoriphagus sp. TaxID=417365 RepID=UPI002597B400|nr:HNH endonuclease [uncultured Algoriphagus sp.]
MTQYFRTATPTRRPDRKECKHYYSYLGTLRADFNQRCGYCDDFDRLRIRSFTIDHFVPQNPKDFEHDIPPNYYYNLVYSCRYCHGAKTNKWPTKDAQTPNDGKAGFIDPINDQYTKLYKRSATGKIIPSDDSELAKYIIKELKLWLPVHERMWKLEKVKQLNDKIEEKLKTITDETIKKELEQLHYEVLKVWYQIQESVFVENE